MVRNYNTLQNLNSVLDRVDPHKKDVVVLHLRFLRRTGGGEYELTHDQLFSIEEQKLFTRAVEIAEKRIVFVSAGNDVIACLAGKEVAIDELGREINAGGMTDERVITGTAAE